MASELQRVRFRLNLPSDEYLAYYQGAAKDVIVRAYDGRTIQFPASALRPYLTHSGVYGEFDLWMDSHHRLQKLERVGP